MVKYMTLWRANPDAWPTDPNQVVQLNEMMFAMLDERLKSGQMLEFGYFENGKSGYAISTGDDAKAVFTSSSAIFPWFLTEAHEVLDYKTGKEILRHVKKAQAEQMAAMKW
ncbi:MAG TPA: hypothetical protein VEF35_02090 [Candidatus Bathyarchaeia archaeon]|nr:hypothetical protein [Candidatus Bathyarchaeia archaeon]